MQNIDGNEEDFLEEKVTKFLKLCDEILDNSKFEDSNHVKNNS